MGVIEKLNAWVESIRAGRPAGDITFTADDLPSVPPSGLSESDKAMFSAQQGTIDRLMRREVEREEQEAATFFDNLVRTGRAVPSERPRIMAQFSQAISDDAKAPTTVKFSRFDPETKKEVEATGSRVDSLKAMLEARPASGFTAELAGADTVLNEKHLKALFGRRDETAEEKDARLDREAAEELAKHGITKKQ